MISNSSLIRTTWINGLTQDYNVKNGIITSNNNLLTECYTRIVTPIGSYFFDLTFGSEIPNWINTRKPLNSSTVITELNRCLQVILDENRAQTIKSFLTIPVEKTRNGIFFLIEITDNNGTIVELDSNYISIPSN